MKNKCRKALQLLRVISSKDWGGDRTTLLRIYQSHIRSKLDYGCIVYGSARRSYLAVLDPIANQGLRLCSGAFRTSPIESLQVETGEPSLETRRLKLSLQYYMKMKANPENPAYSCVVNPEYKRLFNNKPGTIPTLVIRLQPHLEDMRWSSTQLALCTHQNVHPGFSNSLIYFLTSQISGKETPVWAQGHCFLLGTQPYWNTGQ